MAEKLGLVFIPDLLIISKKTKPQTKLDKKDRISNIKGAFKYNKEFSNFLISQLPVIIFDDVWTTGATLKEGAKVLKNNGFKKVWGLTLARD